VWRMPAHRPSPIAHQRIPEKFTSRPEQQRESVKSVLINASFDS